MKTKTPEELKAAFERWRTIRNRCGNHRTYLDWDATAPDANLIIGLVKFASDEVADHCLKYWASKGNAQSFYVSKDLQKQAVRACRNLLERKTAGWNDAEDLDTDINGAGWCSADGLHWAQKWEDVTTGTVDLVCRRFGLSFDDLDYDPYE